MRSCRTVATTGDEAGYVSCHFMSNLEAFGLGGHEVGEILGGGRIGESPSSIK